MMLAIAVPKLPPPNTATVKCAFMKKPGWNMQNDKKSIVFFLKNLSGKSKWHINSYLKLSTFSVDNLVDSFLELGANPYKIY